MFVCVCVQNLNLNLSLLAQYEAYVPMAERELRVIIQKARQRWSLRHVAIAHRIGVVPTAESSVEIAISSTHRKEALAAVQYAIDELKAQVPIWKKEVYDGAVAEWKENKESAAPTVGQMARASQHRRTALCVAAAAAALGVAAAARWRK